jgi:very-short-patch-repair endonuclease
MSPQTSSSIVTVAAWALVILVVIAILLRLEGASRRRYSSRSVMTPNEVEFFRRLMAAMRPGYVFPQVAMSALIEPKRAGRAGLKALRRISQKRVDYTLHDEDLSLICVVELDDRTHDPRRDAERDRLLKAAGIPTLRWNSTPRPSVAEIRGRVSALRSEKQQRGLK